MARNEDNGAEHTDYGKKGGFEEDKAAHRSKPEDVIHAGGDSGANNGPTGSSRHYPKKAPNATHPNNTDWNPMKIKATGYATCGV